MGEEEGMGGWVPPADRTLICLSKNPLSEVLGCLDR